MGYVDDLDKTKESIDAEGMLHTGDLGKMDPHYGLLITGRLKVSSASFHQFVFVHIWAITMIISNRVYDFWFIYIFIFHRILSSRLVEKIYLPV